MKEPFGTPPGSTASPETSLEMLLTNGDLPERMNLCITWGWPTYIHMALTFTNHHTHLPESGWRPKFGLMRLYAFSHASEDDPRLAHRVLFPSGKRQTSYTQRLRAIEMLAWSRWQLGWLEPHQIHCVTQLETETTITISPVSFPGNEGAMIAIPTSETEVIVIESRRKLGYDSGREHQWPDRD